MTKHTIINGNCIDKIMDLADNSVHLIVTSPPYFSAKDYNLEEDNVGKSQEYKDYLDQIYMLLVEISRVLCPGGYVCWNTSPILKDGKRIGIPFDTNTLFEDIGYELLEDIIWVKPDGAAKLRCGGWCQNKGRPTTWHANINTEYIMVYKKPGVRDQKPFDKISKYYTEVPKDLLTSTWYFNPETSTHWHDAPFPYELAKRCIVLYSYPGDVVLDPFLGSGTVIEVARDLNRNSIGIELASEYIEQAKKKIGWNQQQLFNTVEYEER